jgi:hypothetical protein
MTTVIGAAGSNRYASTTMLDSSRTAPLFDLLKSQRTIEAWIRVAGQSPLEVLEIGKRVLQFAEREEEAFHSLLPLMDQAVRGALEAEHQQLREDLHLLEWLLTHTSDSPDVPALAGSLTRRMIDHLERDGRLLARAAHLAAGEK